MKKYLVRLREIEIYEVEVEAESEIEAENKAWGTLANADNKGVYFIESDGDIEYADKIEE